MKLKNSKGKVWYGLHIVPGVAEYDNNGSPFRVLLNESTIKNLDPTFAGRPVYVLHPDEDVDEDLDKLRNEADGWVSESFYNRADGKHWVKFITVTKRAESAISKGYRLSNAIQKMTFAKGGVCNGVSYDKEVKQGEYEHLAIVPDPRYEQSVILSPEEFKQYNAEKDQEILKLANNKGSKSMFTFYKREKLENSKLDLASISVLLPKSNKERTIKQLINAVDTAEMASKTPAKVKVGETEMTIEELVIAHMALVEEVAALRADVDDIAEDEEELEEEMDESDDYDDEDDVLENESDEDDDDMLENEADEDDDEDEKPVMKKKKKVENEKPAAKPAAKKPAAPAAKAPVKKMKNSISDEELKRRKEKARKLQNANNRDLSEDQAEVRTLQDQVARGKSRYGS